jgi:hypothetical protein
LHSAKAGKFVGKAKKVLTEALAALAPPQRNNYTAVQQNIIAGRVFASMAPSPRAPAKRVQAKGVIT